VAPPETALRSVPDYERAGSTPRRRQPEWRHPRRHSASLRAWLQTRLLMWLTGARWRNRVGTPCAPLPDPWRFPYPV